MLPGLEDLVRPLVEQMGAALVAPMEVQGLEVPVRVVLVAQVDLAVPVVVQVAAVVVNTVTLGGQV